MLNCFMGTLSAFYALLLDEARGTYLSGVN
jgi:hypothetical protein